MAKAETDVSKAIQHEASAKCNARLLRNNVGTYLTLDEKRKVKAGLLFPGSVDLIGCYTIEITPELVGCTIAIPLVIDAKKPGWKGVRTPTEKKQEKFIKIVEQRGGIGFFLDNPALLREKINEGMRKILLTKNKGLVK